MGTSMMNYATVTLKAAVAPAAGRTQGIDPLAPSRAVLEGLGLQMRFIEIRCDGHSVNHGSRVKRSRLGFASELEFPDGDIVPWTVHGTLASAATVRTRQLRAAPALRQFERRMDARDDGRRREVIACARCGTRAVFAHLGIFHTVFEHFWHQGKRVVTLSEVRQRYASLARVARIYSR